MSEQAAIKGSCSATDIAAVVSGDNEMTRRMEVQRARRCSDWVRIEELMALVGMIERHAREGWCERVEGLTDPLVWTGR